MRETVVALAVTLIPALSSAAGRSAAPAPLVAGQVVVPKAEQGVQIPAAAVPMPGAGSRQGDAQGEPARGISGDRGNPDKVLNQTFDNAQVGDLGNGVVDVTANVRLAAPAGASHYSVAERIVALAQQHGSRQTDWEYATEKDLGAANLKLKFSVTSRESASFLRALHEVVFESLDRGHESAYGVTQWSAQARQAQPPPQDGASSSRVPIEAVVEVPSLRAIPDIIEAVRKAGAEVLDYMIPLSEGALIDGRVKPFVNNARHLQLRLAAPRDLAAGPLPLLGSSEGRLSFWKPAEAPAGSDARRVKASLGYYLDYYDSRSLQKLLTQQKEIFAAFLQHGVMVEEYAHDNFRDRHAFSFVLHADPGRTAEIVNFILKTAASAPFSERYSSVKVESSIEPPAAPPTGKSLD